MAWLDSQGNYYEGDRANLSDRGVLTRPSAIHIFVDGEWVEDAVQVAAIAAEAAKKKLAEIDLSSIRSIREYIAAKPDAPQYIKDYELQAISERDKLVLVEAPIEEVKP
jgi:hypothetical protein